MTRHAKKIAILFAVGVTVMGCSRTSPAPVTYYGTAAPDLSDTLYRVSEDETVYHIARTTGVDMQALIDMNGMSPPFTILPGQMLKLPKPSTYTVQQDDTVYAIAQAFNVSQSELVSENNLKAPDYKVSLGQTLRIPSAYSPNQRSIFDDSISVAYQPAPSWGSASRSSAPAAMPPPESNTTWSGGAGVTSQDLAPPPSSKSTSSTTAPSTTPPQAQTKTKTASVDPVRAVLNQPVKRSSSKFGWPVQGNVISSFGSKKSGQQNDGINIGVPRGTPVRAAENGVVAYSGNEIEGYGNLLLIRHSDGYMTAYAHLDKSLVKRGDTIKRGQTVASVGSTGNVTSPQLHFEIRKGSKSLNPKQYLD